MVFGGVLSLAQTGGSEVKTKQIEWGGGKSMKDGFLFYWVHR